jgi:hypothetical protein
MRVKYHGITDECTECQHCGRRGLKKTVMLFVLDADGNAEDLTYFGTACAARALGTTTTKVQRAAQEAQYEREKRIKSLKIELTHPAEGWDASRGAIALNGVRREWNKKVRWITRDGETHSVGSVTLNGIEYSPRHEHGFKAFATAQVAAWEAELAHLSR